MLHYLIRRFFYSFFVFIGVTLIVFSLFHFIGSDPALTYAGKNATIEVIESIRHELKLDQPLPLQYIYFLKQTLTFDFGESWSNKRLVSRLLIEALGASLSLTLPAFFISTFTAICIALFCSYRPNSAFDRTAVLASLVLMSVNFIVYIIYLQKYLAFDLSLFPVYGWSSSWYSRWMYITLPGFIYTLVHLGPKVLLFRSAFLKESHQDYVRTAQAKGLSVFRIYFVHILKNSLSTIVTLITSQMPSLITGSLLLEVYFGIPGVGGLLIKAIHSNDFPIIQAMTVLGSVLFIIFNLLNDLFSFYIDARRKIS